MQFEGKTDCQVINWLTFPLHNHASAKLILLCLTWDNNSHLSLSYLQTVNVNLCLLLILQLKGGKTILHVGSIMSTVCDSIPRVRMKPPHLQKHFYSLLWLLFPANSTHWTIKGDFSLLATCYCQMLLLNRGNKETHTQFHCFHIVC